MKEACRMLSLLCLLLCQTLSAWGSAPDDDAAWDLSVSANGRYLQRADGRPFFWLGDTGWLLPHRLTIDDARQYLDDCMQNEFNVVQVQLMNDEFHPDTLADAPFWQRLDSMVAEARLRGIYIAMVPVWGSLVKRGWMTTERAACYGHFLAKRYGDQPNIIWMMGGDIQGDIHPEVWDSLAAAIKRTDRRHLMTFHPRGRTFSAKWFHQRPWLDFNMFQSGHRRYGQRNGDKHYPIAEGTEEDNWQYVDSCLQYRPRKPMLDGEPSYENIPQGLHDASQPKWNEHDVRRYAYWSVFAGSCGHTYGNNEIMQFIARDEKGAYGADGSKHSWQDALGDNGRRQMKYLRRLMELFPPEDRVGDSTLVIGNGTRHQRILACRGKDYILTYNCGYPTTMKIDISKISGKQKLMWRYSPTYGTLKFVGTLKNGIRHIKKRFLFCGPYDGVLIIVDASSPLAKKLRDTDRL